MVWFGFVGWLVLFVVACCATPPRQTKIKKLKTRGSVAVMGSECMNRMIGDDDRDDKPQGTYSPLERNHTAIQHSKWKKHGTTRPMTRLPAHCQTGTYIEHWKACVGTGQRKTSPRRQRKQRATPLPARSTRIMTAMVSHRTVFTTTHRCGKATAGVYVKTLHPDTSQRRHINRLRRLNRLRYQSTTRGRLCRRRAT